MKDDWDLYKCDGKSCHATVGSGKSSSFCMSCHWCWDENRYIAVSFDPLYKPKLPTERMYTDNNSM